jgi:hypothetical protein
MDQTRVLPRLHLAWLGVLVLLAACETLRTGSDFDRTATFAGLHSFTIMQRPHVQLPNPLVVQRTQDSIRSHLQGRGFTYVEDPAQADFAVDFTLGSRERIDIQSYPSPWGPSWYGGPGWWGRPYWGNTIDVSQFQEGTLSIDIFDDRTNRPVWHGWATQRLSQSEIEHSEGVINRAVAAVLERFPPRPGD